MALQSMPWTFRSALLMGVVQFMWCTVAAIAALGSFVALETVSAPNGDSYRAIDCVDMDTDTKPSCMCNGEKISDVSKLNLDVVRQDLTEHAAPTSTEFGSSCLETDTSGFQTNQSLR